MGVNTSRPERDPYPPTTDHPHDREGLHPQTSPDPNTPPDTDAPDTINGPRGAGDPLAMSQLIASGDIDVVPGDPPVPIAVWRVTNPDDLARLLVAMRTRPGDTIVSIGENPALHGAAGAAGCAFHTVEHPDQLADLDHLAGTVGLIVLPWPPRYQPIGMSRDSLVALFRDCRRLMSRQGCTIVALAELPPPQTFIEHSSVLLPAASQAGLGWLQHIIAITAQLAEQHIMLRAAPADRALLRHADSVKIHMDLFVLAKRGGRHD